MRRIWLLSWLIFSVVPSWAAKRLSVAQLEHLLAADVAAHRQDSEIAKQIAGIVPAERISPSAFDRLEAQFHADPLASQALRVIADQSQFLELPADESVAKPAPDNAARARMLQAAQEYVSQTLRGLPNFLATRTITLYDDTPRAIRKGEWPTRAGLHLVGTSSAEISVSREREDQPAAQGSAVWQSKVGLLSGGEFGTTLGMILTDAAQGQISWSRWEGTPAESLAVFRYSVPASASHFELISTLRREASVEGVRGPANERGISGIGVRPNVSPSNVEVARTRPGYHGSIWLNPADGAIYRITMEAETSKGLPFRQASILVEYGPVVIAGRRFICPVRSLAFSESIATAESFTDNAATAWLNETVFTNYHVFGSSSRILDAANGPAPGAAPVNEQAADSPAPAAQQKPDSIAPTPPAETAPATDESLPSPPAASPIEPPAAIENAPTDEAKATPPASGSSLHAQPATGSAASNAQPLAVPKPDETVRFSINVNSLLVPVVVLDKRGQSVAGLGKDDFTVEDDGKSRNVIGFTVIPGAPNKRDPDEGQNSQSGGAQDTVAGTSESAAAGPRHVIFLFDDRHLTVSDLALVKRAATQLLEKPLPPSDDAAVLSFFGVNSGLTRDRAALQSAIQKLTVHPSVAHAKEECPDLDYYAADQIIEKHNPTEFQIAVQKARQCSFSQEIISSSQNLYNGLDNPINSFQRAAMAAARKAVAIGNEDTRVSLLLVRDVVDAISKLPGRRTLILISPGFLTVSPETMAMKSEIMDMAAASDVIVNTLDARGLYAGNLDASQGGTTSTLDLLTSQSGQDHLASMQASENVMSELAEGTGGRFFHNSNDLEGGLETLTSAPANLYLLEVSLNQVKANGAYHRLKVKVDQKGAEVMARKGYFAPKKATGKK